MKLLVNHRSVTLAWDPEIDAILEDELEIRGNTSIEQRFTELDETGPDGRYRFRLADDLFTLDRATYRTPDPKLQGEALEDAYWDTFTTLFSMNQGGVVVDLDQTEQEGLLQELLFVSRDIRESFERLFS